MAALGMVSGGDLRKAITTLQSAVRLGGGAVNRAAVLDVSGQVGCRLIASSLHDTQPVTSWFFLSSNA